MPYSTTKRLREVRGGEGKMTEWILVVLFCRLLALNRLSLVPEGALR